MDVLTLQACVMAGGGGGDTPPPSCKLEQNPSQSVSSEPRWGPGLREQAGGGGSGLDGLIARQPTIWGKQRRP